MAPPILGYKQDWGIRLKGYDNTVKFLKGLETEIGINSQLADRMGNEAIVMIKAQVARNEDMDGKKMIQYSAKYAKRKKVAPGAVDMQSTSQMLKSIRFHKHFERNRTVIIVSPTGTKNQVKTWVHHVGAISGFRKYGRFRMPQRKWFGLQRANRDRIRHMGIRQIEDYIISVAGGQRRLF